MTQEDKELLLVDLCARLPYGVIGLYTWKCKRSYDKELTGNLYDELESSWNSIAEDSQFLPYLRPMSSMTEEESKELSKRYNWRINGVIQIRHHSDGYWDNDTECSTEDYLWLFDWLNEHHFDYRGLIEKGFALEAPEDMYYV